MEGDPMKTEGRGIDPQRVHRLSEASEWLLRLQSREHSDTEYQDWLRWCDADAENFPAFEAVQRKWRELDILKLCPHEARELDRDPFTSKHRNWVRRSVRSPVLWAIAAGIAAVGLAIRIVQYPHPASPPATQPVAAAVMPRAATLPDGSRMILGAQSQVKMDFNGPERQLDLSSGEAYFNVKHDRARPFVVRAGEISVTAIGTAFDVRRHADSVTVTVEEGTVEVRGARPGMDNAVWRAEAGYQLTYSTQRRTASLENVNPSTALSWRNGELAYVHEPLGSVVKDLNRYSTRKIVVADAEVAAIPFTGTAFAASLDGWLAGLEQAYPIDVKESATGEVILSSRK
jgi:transmembrane sensor